MVLHAMIFRNAPSMTSFRRCDRARAHRYEHDSKQIQLLDVLLEYCIDGGSEAKQSNLLLCSRVVEASTIQSVSRSCAGIHLGRKEISLLSRVDASSWPTRLDGATISMTLVSFRAHHQDASNDVKSHPFLLLFDVG